MRRERDGGGEWRGRVGESSLGSYELYELRASRATQRGWRGKVCLAVGGGNSCGDDSNCRYNAINQLMQSQ